MNATRWPFDLAELKRGDSIAAAVVESAIGRSRSDDAYWLELLRVREMVVSHFLERGDDGVIVTTCDGGLQILTDEQAAGYVQKREHKARRDIAWSVAKGSLIDRAKLTNETRERLERWMRLASFRLQQLRKAPPPELNDEPKEIGGGDS